MTTLTYALIGLLVVETLWTIQTSILRAVMGLAATSVLLAILLFQMGAPLAAVFELSVCAGLITVVFVATVSMTRPLTPTEEEACARRRAVRFHPSFLVVTLVGLALWGARYALQAAPPPAEALAGVREVLWGARRLDLVGQILVMFVGVFAVVVLFKPRAREEAGK